MFLTATAKNNMLEALDEGQTLGAKYASLHTAYSATGTNEVSGGSYARQALTWDAAASGSKAAAATLPSWSVPAGTTVRWVGLWSAVTAGTFLGMVPAGSGALKVFAVDDTSADTLKSEAHGFSNGDAVVVWGAGIPSDIAVGTVYFVVSTATDTFQLSTTSGGSAINFTDKGQGFAQKIVPESFTGAGTYAVSALTVDLGAVA